MKKIIDELNGVESVAITGHIRPDGDCIGSIMGLYNYLCEVCPDLDVDVYAQRVPDNFKYIKKCRKLQISVSI